MCKSTLTTTDKQEFHTKLSSPILVYVADSANKEILGPFWVGPGKIEIDMFKTVNNDKNYNAYNYYKYFNFYEGTLAPENKILKKVTDALLYSFEFKTKSQLDPYKDSIIVSQATYFAKIDSVANECRKQLLQLDKTKNLTLINYTNASINNFETVCKLQYVAYVKYFDKQYNWQKLNAKEIGAFYKLKPASADDNYFFAIDNFVFLHDTMGYYQYSTIAEPALSDTAVYEVEDIHEPIVDTAVAYTDPTIDLPEIKSYYLENYEKNLAGLEKLNADASLKEVATTNWLKTLVGNFGLEDAENVEKNRDLYQQKLQQYKELYPNSKHLTFLQTILDKQVDESLARREQYNIDKSYDFVDTAAVAPYYETDQDYVATEKVYLFPTYPTNTLDGKNVDLLQLAKKTKLVVVKVKYFPSEKDMVYYKYLEKKHKKLKFVFMISSTEYAEEFKKNKIKSMVVTYSNDYVANWEDFFYQNYEPYMLLDANGHYIGGYEADLEDWLKTKK